MLNLKDFTMKQKEKFPDLRPKRRFCSGLRRYETAPLVITEPWDTRG